MQIFYSLFFSSVTFFKVFFKKRKPTKPAINEESKIMNFALLIIVWSSKASKVMNIDIVNPIPPKNPTPTTAFQVKSLGSLHNPAETAKKLKR
jgi:hypothetical protein